MTEYLSRGHQCETVGCSFYASHEIYNKDNPQIVIARVCEDCKERILDHMNDE